MRELAALGAANLMAAVASTMPVTVVTASASTMRAPWLPPMTRIDIG